MSHWVNENPGLTFILALVSILSFENILVTFAKRGQHGEEKDS